MPDAMTQQEAAALQAAYAAARREWQRVVWPALDRYREEREGERDVVQEQG